jgi:magnesium-dependent phosphatase-1
MFDRIQASKVQLVVLDLDSTIWNGNAESFHDFVQLSESSVRRRRDGRSLHLFPDVAPALQALHEAGVAIAVASASPAEDTALRLLRAFKVHRFISKAVVKPGRKDSHLRIIHHALGLRTMQRTIFLDDLEHNLKTGRAMGCTCVRVLGYCGRGCRTPCTQHGMTSALLLAGLRDMQQTARSAGVLRSFFCSHAAPPGPLDRPAVGLKRRIGELAVAGGNSDRSGECGPPRVWDSVESEEVGRSQDMDSFEIRNCSLSRVRDSVEIGDCGSPDRVASDCGLRHGLCDEEARRESGPPASVQEALARCGETRERFE